MKREWMVALMTAWMLGGPAWIAAGETETPMIDIPNAVVIDDGILGGGQPDEDALRRAADAGPRRARSSSSPRSAASRSSNP